jgi:hypothetical protein
MSRRSGNMQASAKHKIHSAGMSRVKSVPRTVTARMLGNHQDAGRVGLWVRVILYASAPEKKHGTKARVFKWRVRA